jgi:hypothetical protein
MLKKDLDQIVEHLSGKTTKSKGIGEIFMVHDFKNPKHVITTREKRRQLYLLLHEFDEIMDMTRREGLLAISDYLEEYKDIIDKRSTFYIGLSGILDGIDATKVNTMMSNVTWANSPIFRNKFYELYTEIVQICIADIYSGISRHAMLSYAMSSIPNKWFSEDLFALLKNSYPNIFARPEIKSEDANRYKNPYANILYAAPDMFIQRLLREFSQLEISLALAGLDDKFKLVFLSNMGPVAAEEIKNMIDIYAIDPKSTTISDQIKNAKDTLMNTTASLSVYIKGFEGFDPNNPDHLSFELSNPDGE